MKSEDPTYEDQGRIYTKGSSAYPLLPADPSVLTAINRTLLDDPVQEGELFKEDWEAAIRAEKEAISTYLKLIRRMAGYMALYKTNLQGPISKMNPFDKFEIGKVILKLLKVLAKDEAEHLATLVGWSKSQLIDYLTVSMDSDSYSRETALDSLINEE